MNATENKLKAIATELYESFEQRDRDNGEKFYCLMDSAPQWMTDAVHEAHGDVLPNDWVYKQCFYVSAKMADTEPDNWDDSVGEWADSLVDVYNADRTSWLASHLDFAAWVDAAIEELGHSDQGIFGDIGCGQYRFIESIAAALIQAVRDEAESSDEDEESDD